jgi:hypothetical protein
LALGKLLITRKAPQVVEAFASDLRKSIQSLSTVLSEEFELFYFDKVTGQATSIAMDLFKDWCTDSGTVTIDLIKRESRNRLENILNQVIAGKTADLEIRTLVTDLGSKTGFKIEDVTQFVSGTLAESRTAVAGGSSTSPAIDASLKPSIWKLYTEEVKKFCIQTSHVILARIILYRVAEDSQLVALRLSGATLSNPPNQVGLGIQAQSNEAWVSLIEDVGHTMIGVIPGVFRQAEFDWWSVPLNYRNINANELSLLEGSLAKLNTNLRDILKTMNDYDFQHRQGRMEGRVSVISE